MRAKHLRGQGFASGCVAAACTKIFLRGKDYCNLHADLDNPVSTGMYKRLDSQLRATTEERREVTQLETCNHPRASPIESEPRFPA